MSASRVASPYLDCPSFSYGVCAATGHRASFMITRAGASTERGHRSNEGRPTPCNTYQAPVGQERAEALVGLRSNATRGRRSEPRFSDLVSRQRLQSGRALHQTPIEGQPACARTPELEGAPTALETKPCPRTVRIKKCGSRERPVKSGLGGGAERTMGIGSMVGAGAGGGVQSLRRLPRGGAS